MKRESRAATDTLATISDRVRSAAGIGRDALDTIERRASDLHLPDSSWIGDALKAGKQAAIATDEKFKERPIVMHALAMGIGFALAVLLLRRN